MYNVSMKNKERAKNNRTLTLSIEEIESLKSKLATEETLKENPGVLNKTLNGDVLKMLEFVPDNFADLIIIDPPYNLTKNFNGFKFNSRSDESFDEYLETWFPEVCKKLKPNGSLYMCGDWKCTSSFSIQMFTNLHSKSHHYMHKSTHIHIIPTL